MVSKSAQPIPRVRTIKNEAGWLVRLGAPRYAAQVSSVEGVSVAGGSNFRILCSDTFFLGQSNSA